MKRIAGIIADKKLFLSKTIKEQLSLIRQIRSIRFVGLLPIE